MATKLEVAIKNDDINEFKNLVSNNSGTLEFAAGTAWHQCYLFLASMHGSSRIVEEIIKQKPEFVTNKYYNGYTVMHIAASNGDVSMVEMLIRMSPQLRFEVDNNAMIPLHVAVVNGHVGVVRILADRDSLPRKTSEDQTSLHLALKHCKEDVFEFLVRKVDEYDHVSLLGEKDSEGNCLLHIATKNKLVQALMLLLPAETSTSRRAVRVNSLNNRGLTPLDLYYCLKSRESTARELGRILHDAGAVEGRLLLASPTTETRIMVGHHNTTKWSLKTRNVLLAVLAMIAGAIFTSIFNMPVPILKEKYAVGYIFSIRDVISGRLPTLFYVMVFHVAGFLMSMGMILTLVWSLPIWTVMLFLLISFLIVYFLVVSKTTPKISVRVGSRNIAAAWLVWFLAGGFISVGLTVSLQKQETALQILNRIQSYMSRAIFLFPFISEYKMKRK